MTPGRRVAGGLVGGAAALGCLAVAIAAFLRWGPLSESVDPGPVNFATLVREPSGGDALICPQSLCLRAKADVDPPVFTSSAADLAQELRLYASRSALIDEIRVESDPDFLRFIQRFSFFGAPTFVDILISPRSSGAATVAMYARSDAGANHARKLRELRAWLAALGD